MVEEEKETAWFEKLGALDRRVIFLLIALAVIIPLVVHYTTTIPPSELVQDLYDKVENLPPGSLARQRRTRRSKEAGMPARISEGGLGASFKCLSRTAVTDASSNGTLPTNIS